MVPDITIIQFLQQVYTKTDLEGSKESLTEQMFHLVLPILNLKARHEFKSSIQETHLHGGATPGSSYRGVRAVVTTIVFNPLLINPNNPRIILWDVRAVVTTIVFNLLLINPDNPRIILRGCGQWSLQLPLILC
jgi:hypothetical protein